MYIYYVFKGEATYVLGASAQLERKSFSLSSLTALHRLPAGRPAVFAMRFARQEEETFPFIRIHTTSGCTRPSLETCFDNPGHSFSLVYKRNSHEILF